LTFSREIKKLLKLDGVPGAYAGKLPKRVKSVKRFFIDKENLKIQLEEAIEHEDYEKAASVRDSIRKIDVSEGL
jgi:protein arginine kinase activator